MDVSKVGYTLQRRWNVWHASDGPIMVMMDYNFVSPNEIDVSSTDLNVTQALDEG
jgi:hypothetical protein